MDEEKFEELKKSFLVASAALDALRSHLRKYKSELKRLGFDLDTLKASEMMSIANALIEIKSK